MKAKICFLSLIIILYAMNAYAETKYSSPNKQKITKLSLFLHYNLGGNDANAAIIAQPNRTTNTNSLYPFGTLLAVNSGLRVSAEPTSELVGRAKGLSVAVSQQDDENLLVLCLDFGYTKGKFKGSSFVACSRGSAVEPFSELAVIGGTEKFRMAKGFVMSQIYSRGVSATGIFAIYKVHATLFHN
ncbi:dirigent protein 4-like [Mercurialis annua]|uniref:dirigent protein 4-like n=1 Tax=Mercurialis annua TaxID=3986 RepID=UPI00215E2059|nr:dirigent protein 4-like [Mercurialis annua]